MLSTLYRPPLGLLTDLYQLTMACAYFRAGVQDREGVFHLSFRHNPFGGGFTIAAGLATAVDYLENLRFDPADLDYLASLEGNDHQPLLDRAFLDVLGRLTLQCDLDAMPEGTVVFPHEPLLRVRGPLWQAQLLETALLCIVNFQTLIATKAARVTLAAQGEPVLEFGLRRAQGIDGALSASRAAYIGGCAATSNVLAGRLLGIPVKGTHAHSWVMCFDDEPAAFRAYAAAMPNNCVFLVDTYDTLQGVRNAIEAGRWLRAQGHEMIGIRLDSGDLAYLSSAARRMLDEAGFPNAAVLASNDLDEHLIAGLKQQGATIGVWGVGTRLVTAFNQPAIDGVYKLSAIREPGGAWQDCLKLSEHAGKMSDPGILQVRRFVADGRAMADAIFDERHEPEGDCTIVDPDDATRRKHIAAGRETGTGSAAVRTDKGRNQSAAVPVPVSSAQSEDLLVPVFRGGRRVYDVPPLTESRERTQRQLALFHAGIKRFVNPHEYPAGLEERLHERKLSLIRRARRQENSTP